MDLMKLKDVFRVAISGVAVKTCYGVVEEAGRRMILCATRNGRKVENYWVRLEYK